MIVSTREKPKLPLVCAVTARPGRVARYPISAMSIAGLRLSLAAFLVPAVGWLLFVLAVIPTVDRKDVRLPLRISLTLGLLLLELLFFSTLLAGNCLSGYGLYVGAPWMVVAGTFLSLLASFIFWGTDRLFLRTDVLDKTHLAIRGLHADYLNAVPDFPDMPEAWKRKIEE